MSIYKNYIKRNDIEFLAIITIVFILTYRSSHVYVHSQKLVVDKIC